MFITTRSTMLPRHLSAFSLLYALCHSTLLSVLKLCLRFLAPKWLDQCPVCITNMFSKYFLLKNFFREVGKSSLQLLQLRKVQQIRKLFYDAKVFGYTRKLYLFKRRFKQEQNKPR